MKVAPDLKVTRYAQLKAGELFLYSHLTSVLRLMRELADKLPPLD
jgi:hypothetical protein